MRLIVTFLAFVALAGCGSNTVWVKNGVTQQQVNQDHYDCQREAAQYNSAGYSHTVGHLYDSCMAARGYRPQGK